MDCTEKYQAQVKINPDGSMDNYFCGQPFADASLSTADPLSGYKAAWNFEARWWNYGPIIMSVLFLYDRFGGSHQGSGAQRHRSAAGRLDQRSGLPEQAADRRAQILRRRRHLRQNGEHPLRARLLQPSGAARRRGRRCCRCPRPRTFIYKEFSGFFSPFDVRGQVFITYRYNDPHRADDAWAYDPQSRRVRRVSVEVK